MGGSGCPCLLRLVNPRVLSLGLDFLPGSSLLSLSTPSTLSQQKGLFGGTPAPTTQGPLVLLITSSPGLPQGSPEDLPLSPLPPFFKWPAFRSICPKYLGLSFISSGRHYTISSTLVLSSICFISQLLQAKDGVGLIFGPNM